VSYYTRFEVHWDGEGDFNPCNKAARKQVLSCMEEHLRADEGSGWLDWLKEFQRAFQGQPESIKGLDSEWAESLLLSISARFPEVLFGMRGVGEGLDDVWIRWFRGGKRLKGPPGS
jgi:hypothetical protein